MVQKFPLFIGVLRTPISLLTLPHHVHFTSSVCLQGLLLLFFVPVCICLKPPLKIYLYIYINKASPF